MSIEGYWRRCLLLLMLAASVAEADQIADESAVEIGRAVDSVAREAERLGLFAGLGVAVVKGEKIIMTAAYGYSDVTGKIRATPQTLWYLASTSKSFTGFAISLLVTEGKLALAAPLSELLPNASWNPAIDPSDITMAQLLSHTHGLNGGGPLVISSAFTGAVEESTFPSLLMYYDRRIPGSLVYSNLGYNIAGMIIDRLWPEGWRDFLSRRVFIPAGMADTWSKVSAVDPHRIAMPHELTARGDYQTQAFGKIDQTMHAAGGHLATLGNLSRWILVQMGGGRLDGKQVFPASTVELSHQMIAPHTRDQAKRFAYFDREGWGAGWDIGAYREHRMVSRFGSFQSTRSHLSFLPQRRIGVTAQATGGAGSAVTDIIAALVYDLELGVSDARESAIRRIRELAANQPLMIRQAAVNDSLRKARQTALPRPLADYAGSYSAPGYGRIEFGIAGTHLTYRWGPRSGMVEILDAVSNTATIEVGGTIMPIGFNFDASTAAAPSVTINGVVFRRNENGNRY